MMVDGENALTGLLILRGASYPQFK